MSDELAIEEEWCYERQTAAEHAQGEIGGLTLTLPIEDFCGKAVFEGQACQAAGLAAGEQQIHWNAQTGFDERLGEQGVEFLRRLQSVERPMTVQDFRQQQELIPLSGRKNDRRCGPGMADIF